MLATERHARIIEELERLRTVRVSHLVRLLGVSDMTVRRDLDALRRLGMLEKVHGGATLMQEGSTDEPGFAAKSRRDLIEKEAVAMRAAALVEPGSAIAVSAGTTTHALARHLTTVADLTVVTNSMWVATELQASGRQDVTVLLTGGMRTPSDALVGPLAIAALSTLHVDDVFMGVHGIDATAGFTTPNLMEAETNRAMIRSARRLVVVSDSTKWAVLGLSTIAPLSEAAVLVSDTRLSEEARAVLREEVGELVLAEPDPHRELSWEASP
jgi:DeoR/GlpR family transcriptional regulator of sugar metabolism